MESVRENLCLAIFSLAPSLSAVSETVYSGPFISVEIYPVTATSFSASSTFLVLSMFNPVVSIRHRLNRVYEVSLVIKC